jgi:predicted Zn-dependent protease
LREGPAVLAQVDLQLGLVREAIQDLEAALRASPDDAAVARALAQAKSALGGKR